MTSLSPIVLITTGGTIGERIPVEGASRHLPAQALLGGVPELNRRFEFCTTDLFDIPSTFMTFDRMLQLARAVDAAGSGKAVGIVVTHGTDTLEETAYFVDLISAPGVPVVFTGAMRPPELPSADGPLNLWHACLVASAPHARRRGVLVAMAGEIHAAREVTKAHSQSATAFRSLEFGPIGTVDEDRVVFHRSLPPSPTVPVRAITARVEALKCYADMSDVPLRALIEAGCHGVILETLGSGQVPPGVMAAIRKAIAAGVTVVATTRCPAGRLIREHYGLPIRVEGDERDLLDAGVIFSDFQGPKARIALAVGLSAGLGGADLQRILEMGERAQGGSI